MSYQVKSGDTMSAIAARNHLSLSALAKANPQVKNINLIYVGQKLNVPGQKDSFEPSKPSHAGTSGTTGTTGSAPVSGGSANAGKVPYINQYHPAGAANGYTNGPSNCGPTSMAMIARAFGYGNGMSDAKLINHLGRIGGTTSAGSSVNGIAAMAHAMGKNAQIRGPGANVEWIAQQLKAGKYVVANGDYYAMPPHANGAKTSGHYVTVAGMDKSGNFIVRDPADQRVSTITPQQLASFIRSNPNGGYQIAIG